MAEDIKINTNPLAGVNEPVSVESYEDRIKNSELKSLDVDIKNKANDLKLSQSYTDFLSKEKGSPDMLDSLTSNKIDFEEFTVDTRQTHKTLNSGDLVPIYDDFMPNIDNQERLARQQSTGEKWLNGVSKFGTSLGTTIAGATVGTVYGVFDAIAEGSFQSVFDNDFTRYLDDLNTK